MYLHLDTICFSDIKFKVSLYTLTINTNNGGVYVKIV
jgi:hypothetical protein